MSSLEKSGKDEEKKDDKGCRTKSKETWLLVQILETVGLNIVTSHIQYTTCNNLPIILNGNNKQTKK